MWKAINGWTKERMKARIREWPDRVCGTRPKGEVFGCKYRHNGNACSVGRFIPDELYSSNWDKSWVDALDLLFLDASHLKAHIPLEPGGMMELQEQHDAYPPRTAGLNDHLCTWIDENVED